MGMCGYVPFRSDIEDAVKQDTVKSDGENGPFTADNTGDDEPKNAVVKVSQYERDLLYLDPIPNPTMETTAKSTPTFLGHGKEDDKKPVELGEAAGYEVQWRVYQNLGH